LTYIDDSNNSSYQGNIFIPFASDSNGQKNDILYLKGRVSVKSALDYTVGAQIFTSGIESNS